ncbi:hypothetical protein SNE40_004690 [Patella caerulea]|uniref:TIR domain-containing protein n=1 Tax=Patella caerulea TaxID=87958 RepID=A0AAN8QCQ3_PATCE
MGFQINHAVSGKSVSVDEASVVGDNLLTSGTVIPIIPRETRFKNKLFISNLNGDVKHAGVGRHKRSANASGPADKHQTCCEVFPTICNAEGGCVLEMRLCVQLCVCATGTNGDWCTEVVRVLTESNNANQSTINVPFDNGTQIRTDNSLGNQPITPSPVQELNSVSSASLSSISSEDGHNVSMVSKHKITASASMDEIKPTKPLTSSLIDLHIHTSYDANLFMDIPSIRPVEAPPTVWTLEATDSSSMSIDPSNTSSKLPKSDKSTLKEGLSNLDSQNRTGYFCENCLDGFCINLPGVHDFKPRCVRGTNPGADNTTCPPGFNCRNGHCVISDGTVQCNCHKHWTGHFCDEVCGLDCGDHGLCVIHEKQVCACSWNYTGLLCDKFQPKETYVKESSIKLNSTQWDTIGVCLALIFITGLVLILLPYFLYRKKWLPIRKLVYYFQQYEDDDGKEYDAFISYKSSKNDENFVVHKLYPKLEKELGFKLCLHFRDFLPGEAIANSIIQAIENSRRTIMILTPNYVNSEWCRLEYQKAQHEMLKLKHKIVPIILEDLSGINAMDKNLKSILDTVTYIEYPTEADDSKKYDKFWKMLGLSMPKKKDEITTRRSPSEVPLTSVPSLTLSDSLSDDVFNENVFERSISIPIDTVSENVHFLPEDCAISLNSEIKIQNRDEDVEKETDETSEVVSTNLSIIRLDNFKSEPIFV